ncbi:MAG: hypothetical protein WBQ22_17510, partial [Bradyrhizobium sp.]
MTGSAASARHRPSGWTVPIPMSSFEISCDGTRPIAGCFVRSEVLEFIMNNIARHIYKPEFRFGLGGVP